MNYQYLKTSMLLLVLSFLMLGCDEYDESYYPHPHVIMKSVTTVDSQAYEPAKIFIEFENIGDEDAYDISGMLSLHIGNTIIESEMFNLDRVAAGRAGVVEIQLLSLDTHHDYEYFSLDFGWFDYWDQYYE